MGLDFSRVNKAKADAQSKGGRIDFSKIYYKPGLGKQYVRIVPWKEDPTFPFIEVQFHKYDTFKKYIPTLANWDETDPILKFRRKVYDDVTSSKEDKDFMKNLSPKTSTFVQVIVRGQEDQGVRLWELNVTNRELVLNILSQEEEYGDITDIVSGRDLIVDGSNAVNLKTGKTYIELAIAPRAKTSALSTDGATAKAWLSTQYSPLEQYKRYTAEELKLLLQNFLNPADEAGAEDEDDVPAPAKPAAPKAPAKAPVKQKFAKVEEVEPEEEPEVAEAVVEDDDDDDVPPPAVVAKPKAKAPTPAAAPAPKPKAKPAPVEDPEDLPWEGGNDELAEAIPVAPKAPAKKPTAPAPKAAPKPLSVASKFDALYDDDDE